MGHSRTGSIALGLVVASSLVAGSMGAGWRWIDQLRPGSDQVAEGVLVCGERAARGQAADDLADRCAETLLGRRVHVRRGDALLVDASVAELGGQVDRAHLREALLAVGRRGSIWRQLDEAMRSRRGQIAVAAPLWLPADPLVERLLPTKQELDHEPEAARWEFASGRATEHREGALADLHAAVEAIGRAALRGEVDVELPVLELAPRATSEVVAAIDRSEVLAAYETRYAFAGGQAGRARNVARAAAGVDGLVLMPGQVVSFNDNVGPRSVDNGFAQAGEIYRGELRMGIGGGTCQVASTLHAAAFFAGLDVVERSPHSRPSGYIGIGLDATVAYPTVDLQLRNPYDFPIVVHASSDTPGLLRVELLGQRRLADVDYAAATVGVRPYKRKVRQAHWLDEGRVIQKQKGIRGVVIERVRTIEFADGTKRVEKTTDVYPPTNEVYYVGPGTDVTSALPPLPSDVTG